MLEERLLFIAFIFSTLHVSIVEYDLHTLQFSCISHIQHRTGSCKAVGVYIYIYIFTSVHIFNHTEKSCIKTHT